MDEHIKTNHETSVSPSREAKKIFICVYCNLKTGTEAQLESHVEMMHKPTVDEQDPATTEDEANSIPEKVVICGTCGKSFEEESNYYKHVQIHERIQKFECHKCNVSFSDDFSLEWHSETEHEGQKDQKQDVYDSVLCPFCKKECKSPDSLRIHIENIHCKKQPQNHNDDITVDVSETCTKCPSCKFVGNESQIEKHFKSEHDKQEPFPCQMCGLVLANFVLLQEHVEQVHTPVRYSCNFCNFSTSTKEDVQSHLNDDHEEFIILHNMAAQVNDVHGKFGELGNFCTNVTNMLKVLMDNQVEMKQELFLIRNNVSTQNTCNKKHLEPESQIETPPHQPSKSSTPIKRAQKESRPKTLFIGDSISGNIHINTLEEATKTEFATAKAYSSIHDTVSNVAKHAAKIPEANFSKVIPEKLKTEAFENLVVQAGSVDITNLKTNVEPLKHEEYFRHEAVQSAKNLFNTCENAVKENQNLKKVIIMKQTPRYDPANVDPYDLKPVLSELYNRTLVQCWMSSNLKDRINVVGHTIECSGSIREARYRETKTGKFDGLHLLGSSGRKAYTNSVLNILKLAGMVDPNFDHSDCPQTRHQAGNRNYGRRNNNLQMDVDSRKSECGKKVFSDVYNNYQVPTKNRFNGLEDNNQGNY